MASRHYHNTNHLSIDTANANAAAARRTLPSPMSSTGSLNPCPSTDDDMISTATLSHPPTLSISSVPYPPNSHYAQQQQLQQMMQPPPPNASHAQPRQQGRQRYRSLSGGSGGGPIHSWTGNENAHQNQQGPYGPGGPSGMPSISRRPSVPVNHYYQQQQQGYHSLHQSSYSQHRDQHQQSHQNQPLTPSTPSSNPAPPVVRHPLWRLECSSCKTTLCEQAMQGHLVGDPSKKLFSTNLAIGVLGLPDRPVSIICPCKFHLFACASCGSVCGYNLSQPCAGCETNRGNGHFWIFYAHEIIPHWRTIGDRNMFWDDLPTWSSKIDGNVGR
ncbi:Protein fam72a [Podila verticillata]|nr:Protein fam72a [Podila verticillata]